MPHNRRGSAPAPRFIAPVVVDQLQMATFNGCQVDAITYAIHQGVGEVLRTRPQHQLIAPFLPRRRDEAPRRVKERLHREGKKLIPREEPDRGGRWVALRIVSSPVDQRKATHADTPARSCAATPAVGRVAARRFRRGGATAPCARSVSLYPLLVAGVPGRWLFSTNPRPSDAISGLPWSSTGAAVRAGVPSPIGAGEQAAAPASAFREGLAALSGAAAADDAS